MKVVMVHSFVCAEYDLESMEIEAIGVVLICCFISFISSKSSLEVFFCNFNINAFEVRWTDISYCTSETFSNV